MPQGEGLPLAVDLGTADLTETGRQVEMAAGCILFVHVHPQLGQLAGDVVEQP